MQSGYASRVSFGFWLSGYYSLSTHPREESNAYEFSSEGVWRTLQSDNLCNIGAKYSLTLDGCKVLRLKLLTIYLKT